MHTYIHTYTDMGPYHERGRRAHTAHRKRRQLYEHTPSLGKRVQITGEPPRKIRRAQGVFTITHIYAHVLRRQCNHVRLPLQDLQSTRSVATIKHRCVYVDCRDAITHMSTPFIACRTQIQATLYPQLQA